MASFSSAARPIATLREQATSLEASITLCLADPAAKPVHRVRSVTRRIEAQLTLLDLLPGLPEHAKSAEKVRQKLGKLRRAAGRVRDLDVLRDKLKERDEEPELWRGAKQKQLGKESRQLEKQFKQKRRAESAELVELLRKRQGSVARALEALLETLAPAESLPLPATRLIALSLEWFARNAQPASAERDEYAMHDVRKAAKLVRYLLESAPESARKAHQLAAKFEALQQSGGHWHDLLTLAAEARKRLGKKSELAEHARRLRDTSLAEFKNALAHPVGVS